MHSAGHRANILTQLPARRRRVRRAATARSTGRWTSPDPAEPVRFGAAARRTPVGMVGPVRTLRPDWGPSGLSGPRRPDRTVSVVASWRGSTLHLWGWDGRHTVAPTWFAGAFDGASDPFRLGRLAVLDVGLPEEQQLRPVTLRLNPDRVAPWLRALGDSTVPGESLAWFVAVNRLAAATVAAGQLTPVVVEERNLRVARWKPVADGTLVRRVGGPGGGRRRRSASPATREATVAGIHAALVDGLARDRLVAQRWYPGLPSDRRPSTSAARAVFKALANPDPIVRGRTAPHLEAVDTLAARLDRHHRRALGEPVVLPRLRLVVPDDPFDAWEVVIEVVDELDPGRWCSADDVWQRDAARRRAGRPRGPPRHPGADHRRRRTAGRRGRRRAGRARRCRGTDGGRARRRRAPTCSSTRRRPSSPASVSN